MFSKLQCRHKSGNLMMILVFRRVACVQIFPRYPLAGGWNFDLGIAYKVPGPSCVAQLFNFTCISHVLSLPANFILEGLFAKDVTLTVVLPAGIQGGTLSLHYPETNCALLY